MILHKLLVRQIILTVTLNVFSLSSSAQVIPDQTLGSENSKINSIDELRDRIEGGAIRGSNLFHSFQEFNVSEGQEVYFANPEGIKNIFSRVTGNDISEIFGTLGVDGAANLFFINPNGIIFGENTVIDVGGSFLATTAESVKFADGNTLVIRDRFNEPVLTWAAPIGLSYLDSGNIKVQGSSNNILVEVPSFRIVEEEIKANGIKFARGNSISLLGGNINFDGGGIITEGNTVQLGAVGNGEVALQKIDSLWLANYQKVTDFKNIRLSNGSYIDTSGNRAGAIYLNGKNISVENSSAIVSNTAINSSNNSITINASESLKLFGNEDLTANSISLISSDVLPGATGNGIDINISSPSLELYDGAEIRAVNFSNFLGSKTGSININANQIRVAGIKLGNVETTDNTSANGGLNSLITTSTGIGSSGGNGNNIEINANTLEVLDGASIKADTFGFGQAGNLEIAAQKIKLSGTNKLFPARGTGLFTSLPSGSRSQNNFNGALFIQTNTLEIIKGASIETSTQTYGNTAAAGNINIIANKIDVIGFNSQNLADVSGIFTTVGSTSRGDAGNINIKTDSLNVFDGARIQADSGGVGQAGNINITADKINLSGERPQRGLFRSGITTSTGRNSNSGGNIFLNSDLILIQKGSSINSLARGSGKGGNVTLKAEEIVISGMDSYGLGLLSGIYANSELNFGGNINLSSEKITFTDGGLLSALSGEGEGGNIFIKSDRVELFDSNITASAGGEGNGGNIDIDTGTILGLNSDITATAVFGNGGNIKISSDGVLGLEERKAITGNQTSDVDASSQFGQQGIVVIDNPQNTIANPQTSTQTQPIEQKQVSVKGDCLTGKGIVKNRIQSNIAPSPEDYLSNILTELTWQPGEEPLRADTIIRTPEGKVFAVNSQQLAQIATDSCLIIENIN